MTEAEIMKALECAFLYQTTDVRTYKGIPIEKFSKAVIDLINRKNAEIESFTDIGKLYSEIKAEARAEAIKEFAERVKEAGAKSVEVAFYGNGTETIEFITLRTNLVDQIAKEMGCSDV